MFNFELNSIYIYTNNIVDNINFDQFKTLRQNKRYNLVLYKKNMN